MHVLKLNIFMDANFTLLRMYYETTIKQGPKFLIAEVYNYMYIRIVQFPWMRFKLWHD